MRREPLRRRHARGFTLIEAVMVIVLTGIVIAIVARFIVPATTAYFDTTRRAQMVDQIDGALRRIGRDVAIALPNSVRTVSTATASSLELIPTSGAARYQTSGAGAVLFGQPMSSFAIVGPPLALQSAAQRIAFFNLGAGNDDADAYRQTNLATASNGIGNASTITLSSPVTLSVGLLAAPFRVHAVEQPVTYRCDLVARTLTRYQGYGFQSTQPDPPTSGTSAVLARGISACSFGYSAAAVAEYAALLTLTLTLSDFATPNAETVSLYHALHVSNLP